MTVSHLTDKKIKEKYLIIGADDFGICPSANKAIIDLYEQGRISSTNIIAGAPYAKEAIEYAKASGIPTGVHLTLNSDAIEHPWQALAGVSSITDDKRNLLTDTNVFAKAAKSKDVTAECKAQVDLLLGSGVPIDHIDNHSATLYGINKRLFFINAFTLCRKYNLPFRFPKRLDFLSFYFPKGIPWFIKAVFATIVGIARLMRVGLVDHIVSNPYPIAEIKDYQALCDFYLQELDKLPYGITEMFLHPAYSCPIFSPLTKEWKKREWEAEFLASGSLQQAIAEKGIKVISYKTINSNLT